MHQRKDDEGNDRLSPSVHHHDEQDSSPNRAAYSPTYANGHYSGNGHANGGTNGYASSNPPERYNMPPPPTGPTSYQNHANGQYSSLGPTGPNNDSYNQLPALNYVSTPPSFPGNLLGNLPPYNANSSYSSGFPQQGYSNLELSQQRAQGGPGQYGSYTSVPTQFPRKRSASPSYHDHASWHKSSKDASESNVRGSDVHKNGTQSSGQTHSFYNAARSGPPMHSDLGHTGRGMSSNGNPEGLQNWLAVSQNSNPVDSILRLDMNPSHVPANTNSFSNGLHRETSADPGGQITRLAPLGSLGAASMGRYAKVEQMWYSRLSSQGRWPGAEKRWYDVLQGMSGDLFNSAASVCAIPLDGSPTRVSEECRLRMFNAIYPPIGNPFHPASMSDPKSEEVQARFPSCAALDEALDKYFSSFLREAPFFHIPAFSISTCHPLLLFVMCCIGFGLGKTHDGCHFVQSNFNCVRDRIVGELERKLTSTTKDAMSIFATSFLFLKLAALINDRDHLSPCQLLYISLVSLAQMHGMFSEYGKRTSIDMYNSLNSLHDKWMAWGRVESLKRISVSLMRLDSAYGIFLKSAPTIRVANIEVLLPCDDRLFAAPTAEAWYSLMEHERLPLVMPPLSSSNSLQRLVGQTCLSYYSLHTVLNYLQLRSLDAYQKLLDYQSTQDADQFVLVPFQYYVTEPSLHNMALHVVAFVDCYQSLLTQTLTDWQRTNCLVFWHFLCLSLTMNQDLFEIAAGREGPKAAASAIDSIATWSRTPAARRALVHAASIYELLANRTQSEMSSLYAAFATFAAALVMTLYVFANPQDGVKGQPYELTTEVEWRDFGLAGLNEVATTINGSPTEDFIINGGPCVFNGQTLEGFSGAKYILDRYADMLRDCGRWNYRQMSQILFMMSDLLEQAQPSVHHSM